jgi:hypothetical protein
MARTPNEFALHLMLDGGHHQVVNLKTAKEVNDIVQMIFMQADMGKDYMHIPLQLEGEYIMIRPSRVAGIHVEPIFSSSIDSGY